MPINEPYDFEAIIHKNHAYNIFLNDLNVPKEDISLDQIIGHTIKQNEPVSNKDYTVKFIGYFNSDNTSTSNLYTTRESVSGINVPKQSKLLIYNKNS